MINVKAIFKKTWQRKYDFLLSLILLSATFWMVRAHEFNEDIIQKNKGPICDVYSIQVIALLHGQLTLSQDLGYLDHDWVWFNGAQQIWGIGVSILRLPFELLAKAMGYECFSGKLTWYIYFLTFFFAVRWLFKRGNWPSDYGAAISFLASFFIPVYWLTTTRQLHYDQAVYYLSYLSFFLFLLNMHINGKSEPKTWYAIFLISGFLCMIRPTGLLIGIAIIAGRTYIDWKNIKWPKLLGGYLLFSIGVLMQILINKVRFGQFLGFGHSLSVSGNAKVDYANKFNDPYMKEPIISAAKELIGALFLNPKYNNYEFFESNLFIWQSSTPRFREMYNPTYTVLGLLLLVIGWALSFRKQKILVHRYLGFFSFTCFVLMFAMYLRTPLSTRYLIDFSPAFLASYLSVLIYLLDISTKKLAGAKKEVISIFIALTLISTSLFPFPQSDDGFSSLQMLAFETDLANPFKERASNKQPRDEYSCSPDLQKIYSNPSFFDQILYNGAGWKFDWNCEVRSLVSLYFRYKKCVEMQIEDDRKSPQTPFFTPMVKAGVHPMELVSEQTEGRLHKVKYCLKDGTELLSPVGPLFIGFADENSFTKYPHLKLYWIKSSDN